MQGEQQKAVADLSAEVKALSVSVGAKVEEEVWRISQRLSELRSVLVPPPT